MKTKLSQHLWIMCLIFIIFLDKNSYANNQTLSWYAYDYDQLLSYGVIDPINPQDFNDNISSKQFYLMVNRLSEYTPVKYNATSEKENSTLTRIEIINYLINQLSIKSEDTQNKIKNNSDEDIVNIALQKKILIGSKGNGLNLNKEATLAETIVILNRVLKLYNPEINILKVKINGLSMEPTLLNGSIYFFNKQAYVFSKPERGDIILFKSKERFYIKRIVALENDTVEIKKNKLYVNNRIFSQLEKSTFANSFEKKLIPPQYTFVIGDNVNFSLDSRNPEIGIVPNGSLIGKLILLDK